MEIWTVGHSSRSLEDFLQILRTQVIELVADVRRFPGSRRLPHFSESSLKKALGEIEIEYVHLPELGGRRTAKANSANTAWRNAAFRGYADHMETEEFRKGMERLGELAQARRTAFMCAEACWWQCHRSLIADYLKVRGHKVWNIFDARKVEEHPFTSAATVADSRLSYAATDELPLG